MKKNNKKEYDWLIVGAGFTGAILAERLASQLDQKVLVIDKRDHIAGNAFDKLNNHGLAYHVYGPHIFHTNAPKIFEYLSQFTKWRPYEHKVKAHVVDEMVSMPVSFETIDHLWSPAEAEFIKRKLIELYGENSRVSILKIVRDLQNEAPLLMGFAKFIYEKIFYPYTVKMWNLSPSSLDESVVGRVPCIIGYEDRYFQDRYQFMPLNGYSAMFQNILKHKNISIKLNTSFEDLKKTRGVSFKRLIWTGCIDEYFGYSLGVLPYRTIKFQQETLEQEFFQPCGTVNYPSLETKFTRITEFKHLTGQKNHLRTALSKEIPRRHEIGVTEPYYPIPRAENRALFEEYKKRADELKPNVYFAGRLADYKYLNMDQAAGRALQLFEEIKLA